MNDGVADGFCETLRRNFNNGWRIEILAGLHLPDVPLHKVTRQAKLLAQLALDFL